MPSQPAPAAPVVIPASKLWIAPLFPAVLVLVLGVGIAVAARLWALASFAVAGATMFGFLALALFFIAQEVVVDEVGLTMRRPGDRAAKPLLWTDVAAVAYVRVRGRSNQIEVRRTNGALFVIADYQVGSIHRVARAIDRFYPAGGGGGTPRFVPVSGMAYLGR